MVDWSKCTSKEQEVTGERKDHTFTVTNGTIKIDAKPQDIQADTTTDVLMQYALQRRALALPTSWITPSLCAGRTS